MSQPDANQLETTCHYFVDEAGDGTLFNRKGRLLVGQEGCSHFFMLGLLRVANPDLLTQELEDLRRELLADPYLKDIPSMQLGQQKTSLFFHAKDDVPEVRREVFKVLLRHDLSFSAAIKNKLKVAEYVRQRNQVGATQQPEDDSPEPYRYHPNELYDFLVRRLFKNLLHKHPAYVIHFAKRGNSDRTAALQSSLQTAQERSKTAEPITTLPAFKILAANASELACLQAADYFLWALQRLYEKREERYWNFVCEKASLVIDVDDTQKAPYGTYYTKRKPLSLAALEKLEGI